MNKWLLDTILNHLHYLHDVYYNIQRFPSFDSLGWIFSTYRKLVGYISGVYKKIVAKEPDIPNLPAKLKASAKASITELSV